MKKNHTTQVVSAKKSVKSAKRSKGVIAELATQLTTPSAPERSNSEVMSALIDQLTTPSAPAPAPAGELVQVGINSYLRIDPAPAPPAPAPAPAPSAGVEMGVPNLTSRRINPRAVVRTWRIANNQRKGAFSGGAKYYVQGGEIMIDPTNQRERFEVAVEIPFTDLYLAKVELVSRRSAPAPEVTKVA